MMSKIYEEHALKPGRMIYRLSATRPNGTPWKQCYLYSTAASITEDMGGVKNWANFKREVVPWDGVEEVSCYNGD